MVKIRSNVAEFTIKDMDLYYIPQIHELVTIILIECKDNKLIKSDINKYDLNIKNE